MTNSSFKTKNHSTLCFAHMTTVQSRYHQKINLLTKTVMFHLRQNTIKRTFLGGSAIIFGLPFGASFLYTLNVYSSTPEEQISELHTPYSIYVQTLTNLFMTKLAKFGNDKFESSCSNAAKSNENLLLDKWSPARSDLTD